MKRFDKTTIVLGIITLFVLAFAVTLFVTSTLGKNSKTSSKSSSSSVISIISSKTSSVASSESASSEEEASSTKSSKTSSKNSSSQSSSKNSSEANSTETTTGTLNEGQVKVKIMKAENGKYNVLVLDSANSDTPKKFLTNGKAFNLTLNTRNQMEVDKVYLLDGITEENSKISVSLKAQPKEITE